MSRRRTAVLSALVAFAAAVATTSTAVAQTVDSLLADFEPSGDWLLTIDGQEKPKARIYYSKVARAIIIRAADFPSPVLLDVPGRSVQTLDLMKVAERVDGSIDVLADAALQPSGALTLAGKEASFAVAGKKGVLTEAPFQVGGRTGAQLLDSSAWYRYSAARYAPDSTTLGRLRAEKREVRLLTFFGTWCPHCKEHLPHLLKVEQLLDGAGIDFDYYGLPATRVADEPEAKKFGITGVPIGVVLVDGKEVGRISGSGWYAPERTLAQVLEGAKPAS
jgi:thiol-disulfide isomerase/thioredoxin